MFNVSSLFKVQISGIVVLLSIAVLTASTVNFTENPHFTGLDAGDLRLIAGTSRSNYAIGSFQKKNQVFMYSLELVVQQKDRSAEFESKVKNAQVRKIFSGVQNGEWRWITASSWKYLKLTRTIACGDYPGFKITYEYEITKSLDARRIYLRFALPRGSFNRTGYVENGVMQFRPVKTAEWFGIFRNQYFPYITFGGNSSYGVMIMAADHASWNELPKMLLYSTNKTSYSSAEFMYCQGKTLQPGTKGKYSFYIIPVQGQKMGVEAAEIYAQMQNKIR